MGFLLGFARWKFAPWILLGAVIALSFSHAIMYGKGKTSGVDQERAAQSIVLSKAIEQSKREHEALLQARGWQDVREAEDARALIATLQSDLTDLALLPSETLIHTKMVTHETGCDCSVPSLGPDFWLHYRSAGQRSAPDAAAANSLPSRLRGAVSAAGMD